MGWLSIDNNARSRYIKQTSNVTEISIPRTINSPSKFDIMLFNKNPQHHHIIFQAQKRKSNYNGMQKRKKILGKIFSHRCAFIVLIYNQSLIAITQTITIV